jgi:acetylornithine deacetylase
MPASELEAKLCSYLETHSDRLAAITQDLVRLPSENIPPSGHELAAQRYVAEFLNNLDFTTTVYSLDEVRELPGHPLFWPGRQYDHRPNVDGVLKGEGGGRSLVLSGHIDTVPKGSQPWTRDPFGGQIEGNRLYGRGSNDMKAGIAATLFVVEALRKIKLNLNGDLTVETVVDEEFGGVNGTLAGRLRGFNGDGAIITEPTFLKICPSQRGGRIAQITLSAPGGILQDGKFPVGVLDQVRLFLNKVNDFSEHRRKKAPPHELYAGHADPVPVSITKIFTSPWGNNEPVTIPETCRIEMYWQLMPGENQHDVDREFAAWLAHTVQSAQQIFTSKPKVDFPIRWLPGSAIAKGHPFVQEFAQSADAALGREAEITGFEAPCDMYIFHQWNVPAFLWGPTGANTHAADEYVELDSVLATAKALAVFITRWCGLA